jgi:hypothetical protein
MSMLSDDDVNLRELSAEELDAAWDLWFDLAQTTNDSDPPYSHGVFVGVGTSPAGGRSTDDTPEGCL